MFNGPRTSGIGGSFGFGVGSGAFVTATGVGMGTGTGVGVLAGEHAETIRAAANPAAELFVVNFIEELLRIGGTTNVEQESTRRKEWLHFLYSVMIRCKA